jgi:hypothetical protein
MDVLWSNVPPRRRRAVAAAVLLALLLFAGVVAAATGPPAVATDLGASQRLSERQLDALTVGDPKSKVLDAIEALADLDATQRDDASTRDPDRYDVLLVDAEGLSPRRLESQPDIERHFEAGRRVLVFNVTRRDHLALQEYTGFEIPEGDDGLRSEAFLFGQGFRNGLEQVEMVDAGRIRPLGAKKIGGLRLRQLRNEEAVDFARTVLRRLADRPRPTAKPAERCRGASEIVCEAYLQHAGWSYTDKGSRALPNGYWTKGGRGTDFVPQPGKQNSSWKMEHIFDVYLGREGSKDNQIVSYELRGSFSPAETDPSGGGQQQIFFHMFDPFSDTGKSDCPGGCPPLYYERAWWTGYADVRANPGGAAAGKLTYDDHNPKTVNGEKTYTHNSEFEVGFTGGPSFTAAEGPGGSANLSLGWRVGDSTSHTVKDWGVDGNRTRDRVDWTFSARNDCDVRPGRYKQRDCFEDNPVGKPDIPKQPNPLSLGELELNTNGHWHTSSLLTGNDAKLDFDYGTSVTLADTFCYRGFIAFCFGSDNRDLKTTGGGPNAKLTQNLDLSVVNPIPYKLTLSPNPANGAAKQKVNGVVELDRAVTNPNGVDLVVISNREQAQVAGGQETGGRTYKVIDVAKGAKKAEFQLNTNRNGVAPNDEVTVTVRALIGSQSREVALVIRRP